MTETQKNILIVSVALALTAAVAVGIFTLVSHAVYRRSNKATLIELFLRAIRVKSDYKISGYAKYMSTLDNSKCPRPKKLRSDVEKFDVCGCDVYTLKKSNAPDIIILYLPGGAYMRHGTKYSWIACDKIVQQTNAIVVYPLYPLAPQNDHKKAYALLETLYSDILSATDKQIIIMGDSAGGGLAFGFCEHLKVLNVPQPSKLITFSPWLDISLSNEKIPEIEPKDAMLASYGAIETGKLWTGDASPTDYKVSPVHGDVSGLQNVYMFVGTREILYPDVMIMSDKLKSAGVKTELYVGDNMPHDYPLYPMPEGKHAIEHVCKIITEK